MLHSRGVSFVAPVGMGANIQSPHMCWAFGMKSVLGFLQGANNAPLTAALASKWPNWPMSKGTLTSTTRECIKLASNSK